MGFLASQHGQSGAIPLPPFLSVSPLESMQSGGAIPPLKRGISAIPARYPMKTRQMGAIPPSAILSRKGIARYGGVSRTGPLRAYELRPQYMDRQNEVVAAVCRCIWVTPRMQKTLEVQVITQENVFFFYDLVSRGAYSRSSVLGMSSTGLIAGDHEHDLKGTLKMIGTYVLSTSSRFIEGAQSYSETVVKPTIGLRVAISKVIDHWLALISSKLHYVSVWSFWDSFCAPSSAQY